MRLTNEQIGRIFELCVEVAEAYQDMPPTANTEREKITRTALIQHTAALDELQELLQSRS